MYTNIPIRKIYYYMVTILFMLTIAIQIKTFRVESFFPNGELLQKKHRLIISAK